MAKFWGLCGMLIVVLFLNSALAKEECLTEVCAKEFMGYLDFKYRQTAAELFLYPDVELSPELILRNSFMYARDLVQKFDWENFQDPLLKRQFQILLRDFKYPEINNKFRKSTAALKTVGRQKFTCDRSNTRQCKLISYIRDIKSVLTNSNDLDEMKWYWREWRNNVPDEVTNALHFYIDYYQNISAVTGPPSMIWYEQYEDPNFFSELEYVMTTIEPLYKQLHAHLRQALKEKYGETVIPASGLIPQHLMEQALYQAWKKESVLQNPYPQKKLPNLQQELRGKRWKPFDLVETSEQFFNSMGFTPFSETFKRDNFQQIEENMGGPDCKSRIYTFSEIEMTYCPKVNYKKLLTTHGDITHLEYAMLKNNLTMPLSREACPGFSNALAEATILSVSTPKHLQQHLGLLMEFNYDEEMNLNFLYRMAIHALLSIPNYFVHEKLWIDMIDNKIKPVEYKCHYWNLMGKYMGVAPSEITEHKAYDMPPKFYEGLVEESKSTKKLVGEFMGYQIYRDICLEVGEYQPENKEKPLFKCDLTGNKKAGDILKKMMTAGSTKSWREIVNGTKIEGSAFLQYYEPLHKWLTQDNAAKKLEVGWQSVDHCKV